MFEKLQGSRLTNLQKENSENPKGDRRMKHSSMKIHLFTIFWIAFAVSFQPRTLFSADSTQTSNLRLVVTGNMKGSYKSCHCPWGQPGGLERRKTIFDRLRGERADNIFIDCGRLTHEHLDSCETAVIMDLMGQLNYSAIVPYVVDFDLLPWPNSSKPPLPYVMSNLTRIPPDFDPSSNPIHQFPWYSGVRRLKVNKAPIINLTDVSAMIIGETAPFEMRDTASVSQRRVLDYYQLEPNTQVGSRGLMTPYDGFPDNFPVNVNNFAGLLIYVRNILDSEDSFIDDVRFGFSTDTLGFWKQLDVLVVGGGGFIEPKVQKVGDLLVVYPGLFGGHVTVVDLWLEGDRRIAKYEWQAIPTESAPIDSGFVRRIENCGKK